MAAVAPARRRTKKHTISFWELVEKLDGPDTKQLPEIDWHQAITSIGKLDFAQQFVEDDPSHLVGSALYYGEGAHLKLLRTRGEETWLSVCDLNSMSVEELELDNGKRLSETSVVAFLGYGNMFGIIRGAASAPTPQAVARYLEKVGVFGPDLRLGVRPVVSRDARDKLERATEVSRVELKLSSPQAARVAADNGGKLASMVRAVTQDVGDYTVTIIMSTSRARANHAARKKMREDAATIAAVAGTADVAKANLIYYDDSDQARRDHVDFVSHRITAKREIPTVADDGVSIRNEAAVSAILTVAAEHEEELKAAVGAVG